MPKVNFSEYGHVRYQIKVNVAHNSMLANVLPLHSIPLGGSKGHFFFSFLKEVMLHIKLMEMMH